MNSHEHDLLLQGIEPESNHSNNPTFQSILAENIQRRTVLKGGVGATMIGALGLTMTGCKPNLLGFTPVAANRDDTITVPEGYSAKAFVPWGTPITGSFPAYREDGTNTGEEQEQQVGQHHDGMHFFPIDCKKGGESSTHGLLVMNHEYIDQGTLHPAGATLVDGVRPADEVRKEVAAHGVSVIEIAQDYSGEWHVVPSSINRRITGATEMEITGPAAGHAKMVTKFSPDGTRTRGTLNNCAHGYTPWNTYLTCEENWAGYFRTGVASAERPRELSRYGTGSSSRYRWESVNEDVYKRFDVTPTGASAAEDYRNEANTFGWIVEVDPFNPTSTPVKHTALGRFAHEGIVFQRAKSGQPVVCYSGDDATNEYIYKFVSKHNYSKRTAGSWLLDEGTLYVAKFNADGTGEWLPLDFNDAAFQARMAETGVVFADQGDVLINTRTAADMMGATKMDRPEWGAVHPRSGEVYFTLTNNSGRSAASVDAANPRGPNPYGHIIRWNETSPNFAGTGFMWDIFLLAGPESDSAVLAAAGAPALNEANIHASPDGLWFDEDGRMWIQTDMSGSQLTAGPFGNNQMLAADPNTGEVRRFLVGPYGCEVTGVINTPNARTMFVNIQHPGEPRPSDWPDGAGARPRSATVIVTKNDGGKIGG